MMNQNEKGKDVRRFSLRRAIASFLVAAECFSLAAVGVPASYAEETLLITEQEAPAELSPEVEEVITLEEDAPQEQPAVVTPLEAAEMGADSAAQFADEARRAAEEAELAAETAVTAGGDYERICEAAARASEEAQRAQEAAQRAQEEADWSAEGASIAADQAAQAAMTAETAAQEAEFAAQEAERLSNEAELAAEAMRQAEAEAARAFEETLFEAATDVSGDPIMLNDQKQEKPAKNRTDGKNGAGGKNAADDSLLVEENDDRAENAADAQKRLAEEKAALAREAFERAAAKAERLSAESESAWEAADRARDESCERGAEAERAAETAAMAAEAAERAASWAGSAREAADRALAATVKASEIEAERKAEIEQEAAADVGGPAAADEEIDDPAPADEITIVETKADETKADETEADEAEGDEAEGDETKADETKDDEAEGDETEADETEADETKDDETKADETKADETKADEAEGDETKADETKSDEAEGDEAKGDETKADETKADETKADEAEGDETKSDETKADETKGDETKSDETKADETKGDETKADEKTTDDDTTEKKEEASAETLTYSDGAVSLTGEAPADVVVETKDVSDDYADFDPSVFSAPSLLKAPSLLRGSAAASRTTETKYSVLAAYDISLTVEGEEYQPTSDSPLKVSISDPAISEELSLQVWHIRDDGSGEQITDFTVEGDSVTFLAESFSAYLVVQVTVTTYITAGDGNTYRVSVTYDQDANMPENADLAVRELGDGEKADYVNQCAETLGKDAEDLLFARAFDISLLDPETGDELQPASGVKVSISLLDTDLNEADELNLLHFGDEVETVDYTLNGGAVEFEADGFSVYVITGTTYLCTYYFYTYNEYGDYAPYYFFTDQGMMASALTIKNGEKLFAPNNPSHPSDSAAAFIGWYVGSTDTEGHLTLEDRVDFNQEQNIGGDDKTTVYLYAQFTAGSFIRFHGQYDAATDSYPVVETYRVDNPPAEIEISDFTATYYNPTGNNAFPAYRFSGWSESKFPTPGDGEAFKLDSPYSFTESVDLYPLFEQIRWLSLVSGHSGTGATYFSPMSCAASEGISESELSAMIPQRPGYAFQGWYLNVENAGTDLQNGEGLQLTDEEAKFVDGFNNIAGADYGVGVDENKLWLSDNVTLYARWEAREVDYRIVVWKQVADDSYGFSEYFTLKAIPYNSVSDNKVAVGDDYQSMNDVVSYNLVHEENPLPDGEPSPYASFALNSTESDTDAKEIAYDGTTVFNLYYDRAANPESGKYTLTFDYPGETADVSMPFSSGEALDTISEPAAPESRDGYGFGWYADMEYTTRVFFKQADYDAYEGAKALYLSMPEKDLTAFGCYFVSQTGVAAPDSFTLTFAYPDGAAYSTASYTAGASLSEIAMPQDPEPPEEYKDGYDFFWYADLSCTKRVFFSRESYDRYRDGPKERYLNMPAQDLTVYGGWTEQWYLIQIDPNYGEMRDDDTNATYFWKTYHSDYIQEYTWITRDYVESESGNFYYVNHNYANGGSPRRTYYTLNVSEATELKTFKYAPGTYVSAGWYEVNPDGTETLYTFGNPIEGNTTLKLHWKQAGKFYLEYNAVVTVDGERLVGSFSGGAAALQDENAYLDQAVIDLTRTAEPPEGYEFIGWRVRGDESGKIWYPGDSFVLPAQYAVTVSGKQKVFLDAVYDQAPTATIVYDANGGTVTESADGGYPYKFENKEIDGVPQNVMTPLTVKIARDTEQGTVTVSGIVNNSPILLSSGDGFMPPEDSGWVLSGWNTEKDGSGTHFELGAWKKDGNEDEDEDQLYYVDVAEPTKLYAEWRVRAYFDKNGGTAEFSGDWDGYTLEDDASDPHHGQKYKEVFINAKLAEPKGTVTQEGLNFDFWSTRPDGDQYNAFDFANSVIDRELTLYAHMTNAIMVPFHVTEGTVDKDSWRRTTMFRVAPNITLNLTTDDVRSYVDVPDGYVLAYACVSDSPEHVSDSDDARVVTKVSRADTTDISLTYKDDHVGLLTEGQEIYLVFAPETPLNEVTVQFVYVKETAGGGLEKLKGYDGGDAVTYNEAALTQTGVPLQDEIITVNTTLVEISQDSTKAYHMLPLLDDAADKLSQIYYKIALGSAYSDGMNISDLDERVNANMKLYLQIRNNKLCWSFDSGDEKTWTQIPSPTGEEPAIYIYAIYRERGYELEITKTVVGEDTGIDPEKTFTVTLSSEAITRESYTVEGTGYNTVDATPATATTPGTIVLRVKGGSAIRITGAAHGEYTITETRNEGFDVSAKRIVSSEEFNGLTLPYTWDLEADTRIDLYNTANPLCRIMNADTGDIEIFYTLNRALTYAGEEMEGTATIEMLMDYVMPSSDALVIPSGYNITLTGRGAARTIIRDPDFDSGPMFTNYGTLTLDNTLYPITIDGNGENVTASEAMISSQGTLILGSGATLQNANCSGAGGAVCMTGGALEVQAGATLADNAAAVGGAIYAEDGRITITGGSFTGNSAENGGVICYVGNGLVTITDGSFGGNSATENGGVIFASGGTMAISGGAVGSTELSPNRARYGGAVYMNNAILELEENASLANNTAESGGAIYVETGTLDISSGSISGNSAASDDSGTVCNGGAVYIEGGTISVSGGSMTKNSASTGSGGAVYVKTGALTMTGGTIGGAADKSNTAKNGAGVFVNTGTASFSSAYEADGKTIKSSPSITFNTASDGGAIGMGSDTARLYFAGKPTVQNNKCGGNDSNIYLDKDSDEIINVDGLVSGAYIGVYVPGDYSGDLFKNRGTVCARYATFTDSTTAKTCLKNDRLNTVETGVDTASNKLYWYRSFMVEARKMDGNKTLPTIGSSTAIVSKSWYNPPTSNNLASEIAEDFPVSKSVDIGARAFAGAYITGASSFGDYITEINWDDATQRWIALKRDGTTIPYTYDANKSWLILYYSNPAYLSIENNDASHTLTINSLQVDVSNGYKETVNSTTQAGYGYVVAINGATLDALRPISDSDMTLAPGESIKFLFPGAVDAPFEMTGSFVPPGAVVYTLSEESGEKSTNDQGEVSIAKRTKNTAGATYEILFGGNKTICKIVAENVTGEVASSEYVRKDDSSRSDGKTEYLFGTLTQAVNFANNHQKTSSIEMLTDYLVSTSDNVSIPAGCNINFTTAVDDGNVYPGTSEDRRATLSRDSGNTASLIKMEIANGAEGSLSLRQLDVDGKNLGGSNEYGIIKTKNCDVRIEYADFKNCKAMSGGGISIDFAESYSGSYGLYVDHARFINCASTKGSRVGGGAIWTCAKEFTLQNSYFEKCSAYDQGGAVFHRIDAKKVGANKSALFTYAPYSKTVIINCQFINCEAGAAGGLETEAYYVEMTDCTFRNCRGTSRNAGAVNLYIYEGSGDDVDVRNANTDSGTTEALFKGCVFESCTAANRGGGIRCLAQKTMVYDCTFKNCTTKNEGGAICVANKYADSLDILGCTMDGCFITNNGKMGGGVYCNALTLTIGDYTYVGSEAPKDATVGIYTKDSGGNIVSRSTDIVNCESTAQGGGIAAIRDAANSAVSITNATVSNNKSKNNAGGGLYTKARNAALTGCTIQGNTASGNGGGVCDDANNAAYTLTFDNCSVTGNSASGSGGGIYTKSQLTLRNNTQITGNRLSSGTKDNAAGVYLLDNRTLTVGVVGLTSDNTSVKGNVTASNAPSNMRLWWESSNKKNSANSVNVLCSLSGKIYVINAARKGDKFGVSSNAEYLGFKDSGLTEMDHTFIADDGSLFGVFDRTDEDLSDGKNIIWRGDIVCKLTDASGKILYLDEKGQEPAIFDRLDYATNGSPVSPFSYMRQAEPPLWIYNEQRKTYESFDVNTSACCVKLLTESYTLTKQIVTNNYPARNIILTTAGRTDSLYPYTGRAGTRAAISRGTLTGALMNVQVNLTLRNIILDGDGYVCKGSGGLIYASASASNNANTFTITLAENAMLQNSGVMKKDDNSGGNGGAVYLSNCGLSIVGGTIYNCTARNGGAVYRSGSGTLEFSSGLITRCSATENGGGIAIDNGTFEMSGGSQITRCSAKIGGGVFVNTGKTMEMSGGSITLNTAEEKGGGIAALDNATLSFSGRVTVNGNTCGAATDAETNPKGTCNVELDYNKTTIINSGGLDRGSYVGVYVSGTYVPLTDEERSEGIKKHSDSDTDPYRSCGGEGDPFGKWTGDSKFLYFFVNDRNGLKGGLTSDQAKDPSQIYWTTIFSLEVSKLVMSDDIADQSESFSFTVQLGGIAEADGSSALTINESSEEWEDGKTLRYKNASGVWEDGTSVPFVNGRAEFELKTGQHVTWNNLPAGISYVVTEMLSDAQKAHFTTFPADRDAGGNPVKSGKIGENLNKDDVDSKYLSKAAFRNMTAICKLTLSTNDLNDGALLYEYDDDTGLRTPAVYSRLLTAFEKINDATPLYYRNGFTGRWTLFSYENECNIEMLIPSYTMTDALTLDGNRTVCLTTAEPNAEDYPYVGIPETLAEINRGGDVGNDKRMFTADGHLTFEDIVLDGSNIGASVAGPIAGVTAKNGVLTVADGALLQNARTSGNGGAVYVEDGTVTMTGGKITGNNAKGYGGGAIRMEGSAKVTISGGEITGNTVQKNDANGGAISVRGGTLTISGGTIKDNTVSGNNAADEGSNKAVGGAIYVHSSASATITGGTIQGNTVKESSKAYGGAVYVDGGKLYLSGGTFNGNTAVTSGPGIYLTEAAKLYLSEAPVFGDGTAGKPANTVELAGYSDKKNGGESVYGNNKVRQDIYIAGYSDTSVASLIVNGDITSGDGTIWVWAEKSPHYETLQQFAQFNGTVSDDSLKAFRNACDDTTTKNSTGAYLYGIKKEGDTTNVYWNGVEGSARVILVKVQSSSGIYTPLPSKTFTVYTDSAMTNLAKGTILDDEGTESDVELKNLFSGAGGAFFIGELGYGTYYVKETGVDGYFEITIDEGGVVTISGSGDSEVKTPVKEVNLKSS